jgi:hypothetical protein
MQKIIIILCALFISVSAFSQQTERRGMFNRQPVPEPVVFTPVNELSFNLMSAIFWSYPEIAFERVFREDMSFGISAGFHAGRYNDFAGIKFNLTPYFRWFFGGNRTSMSKPGAGFFIEANGAILYREAIVWSGWSSSSNNEFGAGIGMSIGWKFVSTNNWTSEVSFGAGRDFTNDRMYPRIGVSVGRRF